MAKKPSRTDVIKALVGDLHGGSAPRKPQDGCQGHWPCIVHYGLYKPDGTDAALDKLIEAKTAAMEASNEVAEVQGEADKAETQAKGLRATLKKLGEDLSKAQAARDERKIASLERQKALDEAAADAAEQKARRLEAEVRAANAKKERAQLGLRGLLNRNKG